MSEKVTNPVYGKFDEVVDALVQEKPSPEDEAGMVREEDSRDYGSKKRRKRSGKHLALLALLLLPAPAAAQARDTTATFKDWPVAFTLELLVPTLGHVYAGDFDRGIAPAIVMGLGVGIMGISVSMSDPTREFGGIEGLLAGFGVVVGGKTWGLVSAVRTTLDHNRGLVERVTPALGVTPDGRASFGVSVRF